MDHWRNQEEEKKKPGEEWNNDPKSMGCSKNSPKREVYSNTNLPQETRKPKVSRKREILKKTEVNEVETKK